MVGLTIIPFEGVVNRLFTMMDQSGYGEEAIMEKVFNCLTVPTHELSFGIFAQELFTGHTSRLKHHKLSWHLLKLS